RRGQVEMSTDLVIRFDYGRVVPWVRRKEGALVAIGGPDGLCLRGDVEVHGEDMATVGRFARRAAARRVFGLTSCPSHAALREPLDPLEALAETEGWWRAWSNRCA